MILKTREKIIEIARQLFANKGIEHTTMNDIANASEKGRRTIYTYFKNKRDIFNAVIEHESELAVAKLREIVPLKISCTEKLEKFLATRFEMANDTIVRQDGFRTFFNRDMKKIDMIRKLASIKEIEILKNILDEGIRKFEFIPEQANRLISLIQTVLQGIDFSYIRDNTNENISKNKTTNENTIQFILSGIKL